METTSTMMTMMGKMARILLLIGIITIITSSAEGNELEHKLKEYHPTSLVDSSELTRLFETSSSYASSSSSPPSLFHQIPANSNTRRQRLKKIREKQSHPKNAHSRRRHTTKKPSSSNRRRRRKNLSFTERQRRRNERNRARAHKRAGKYAPYIHGGATRIDFGCGSHGRKCRCPLPLDASFNALQVEGARLLSEQRLQESSACYEQALDMYLERVGRYYIGRAEDGTSPHTPPSSPLDRKSPSSPTSSSGPVPLSPTETADARATAQAIIDRLNAGPPDGWSTKKRRRPAELERLNELAKSTEMAANAVKQFEQARPGASFFSSPIDAHSPSSSGAPLSVTVPRQPWNGTHATHSAHARVIAKIYELQLREQWKDWGTQGQTQGNEKKKAKNKR